MSFAHGRLRRIEPSGWVYQPGGPAAPAYLLTDSQVAILEASWRALRRCTWPWKLAWLAWAVYAAAMQYRLLSLLLASPSDIGAIHAAVDDLPQPFRWLHHRPPVLAKLLFALPSVVPVGVILWHHERWAIAVRSMLATASIYQPVAASSRAGWRSIVEALTLSARLKAWATYVGLFTTAVWLLSYLGPRSTIPLLMYGVAFPPSVLAAIYVLIRPRFFAADASKLEQCATCVAIVALALGQIAVVLALLHA